MNIGPYQLVIDSDMGTLAGLPNIGNQLERLLHVQISNMNDASYANQHYHFRFIKTATTPKVDVHSRM